MKIRFTTTVNDNGYIFKAGENHDLPNEKANHFVQSGLANKTPEGGGDDFKVGVITPGPVKAPDAASQAAVDEFNDLIPPGVAPVVALSSGNPPAARTTAVAAADSPAYVAAEPLPSAGNVETPKPKRGRPAKTPKPADAVPVEITPLAESVPATPSRRSMPCCPPIRTNNPPPRV